MKLKIASYTSKIADRWLTAGKSKEQFVIKNRSWLGYENMQFHVCTSKPQPHSSSNDATCVGRLQKEFEDPSFKTRKRRVLDLVQSQRVEELMVAAEVAAHSIGHRNIAKVIREIMESPQKVGELKKASPTVTSRELTSDEMLC